MWIVKLALPHPYTFVVLASLRILSDEAQVQARAADAAERSLALALDRYRAGATAYLDVVLSQTAALSSERVWQSTLRAGACWQACC